MEGVWKDIPNFNGEYKVSDKGQVLSLKNEKQVLLKPNINRFGYATVDLCKNGKRYARRIHRLVAETFIEKRPNENEVNHIDGNKLNNSVENLEWCTRSQNIRHSFDFLGRTTSNTPVECIETHDRFSCIKEACKSYGLKISQISHNINGYTKSAGGYHWKKIGKE